MSIITSYGNGKHSAPRGGSHRCTTAGCHGEVVRHSLGCGMAVGRCTRCFARYELGGSDEEAARPSTLRRVIREIITWREED